MSNVLVAYASKHGATEEIAAAIADQLRQDGHQADCIPAGEVGSLEPYDAIVVGSAVDMKRWRTEAKHLLKRNADTLAQNCPPDKRDLRDWDQIRGWAAGIGRKLAEEVSRPVAPHAS